MLKRAVAWWVGLPRMRLAMVVTLVVPFGAAIAIGVPDSGQLLQETPPPVAPTPLSKPGLTIEQPAVGRALDSVPFLVQHIEIEGNTLLPTSVLRAFVEPGEGKTLTLTDLEGITASITRYYQDHGYLLSRAYIPAQTLSNGTVRIVVLEARYGAVSLANTSKVSDTVLQAILAPLQAGRPVTEDALQRSLLLLSDVPGLAVNSVLAPGDAVGSSNLQVSATPGAPYNGSIGLDDAGNRHTGRARLNATIDYNNPFHIGDVLSLTALTAGSDLNYARLGYQALVSGDGTMVGGSVSGLKYRLSHGLSALKAHGTAEVEGLTVMQPFIRTTAGNLFAQLAFDSKQLRDEIDASNIHTNRHTDTLTSTLAGDHRDATGISNMNLGITYGHLGFDDEAADQGDSLSARTQGNYGKYTLSLARLQGLSESDSLYLAFNGQLASKNLDSSEQFFLGGPNSVRAYDVGAVGGAAGGLISAELRHNLDFVAPGAWQAIAFVDSGVVRVYRRAFASGANRATLSGTGLGLSWVGPNGWTASAVWARRIGPVPELVGHTNTGRVWIEIRKSFSGGMNAL